MRFAVALTLVAVMVMSLGCAVSKKSCGDCTPETIWQLNIASQLRDNQRDYKQFFTDVGVAHRSGQLTDDEVAKLNEVGHKLQKAIEESNQYFKSYVAQPDGDKRAKVVFAVQLATQIFAELLTKKSVMITQQKAQLMHGYPAPAITVGKKEGVH